MWFKSIASLVLHDAACSFARTKAMGRRVGLGLSQNVGIKSATCLYFAKEMHQQHILRCRTKVKLFSNEALGFETHGRSKTSTYAGRNSRAFSTPTNGSPPAHQNAKPSIVKSSVVVKVKDLEEHLRIRGYSTLRWGLGILAAAGFAIYMFREPIKENLSDEVADVATRSLGDQNVVLRANEMSKAIVNELINDANTLEMAADFVIRLLLNEGIKNQAKEFVTQVLNAPETRENVTQLAADIFANLLEAAATRALLLNYIQSILSDKFTVECCRELLNSLAADPQSKQILADFFKSVLNSETVTNQAVVLGKNVTYEIVVDKKIQEETGNALWGAVMLSLTPRWLASKEVKHQ